MGTGSCGCRAVLVHQMPRTLGALGAGVCSEAAAVRVAQAACVLTRCADRAVLDGRVGPLLGRLGVRGAERAARAVAAELDAAAVVARMEAAVRSRRVTVRAAPDGMGYLSVLGPMVEVAGAHAALLARARSVVAGHHDDEPHAGRGVGAVAADTALAVLSGRAVGQVQPVEVHLVMTDRALLGTGDPHRSVMEPARVPGHSALPAPLARWWLRDPGTRPRRHRPRRRHGDDDGTVWLRRLYTTPSGRDLVAMDSRRRTFTGLLRRMLVLRDDLCTTPWCGAAIAHADHATPARDGGATNYTTGNGKCARCNHTKEAPGWTTTITEPRVPEGARGPEGGRDPGGGRGPGGGREPEGGPGAPAQREAQRRIAEQRVREVVIRTPLGRTYRSQPPPLLGWGSATTPPTAHDDPTDTRELATGRQPTEPTGRACHRDPVTTAPRTGPTRRPLRRPRRPRHRIATRRPRLTSHLERRLCRYLT